MKVQVRRHEIRNSYCCYQTALFSHFEDTKSYYVCQADKRFITTSKSIVSRLPVNGLPAIFSYTKKNNS